MIAAAPFPRLRVVACISRFAEEMKSVSEVALIVVSSEREIVPLALSSVRSCPAPLERVTAPAPV